MKITSIINNIKAMPCKVERIVAASLLLVTILLPQHLLHGFDHMGKLPCVGMILMYIYLPLAIDHDMLDSGSIKYIWIASMITGLTMLPISFAQQYTVGFHIIAVVAFITSTILIESWCHIQINRKVLFELNPEVSLYEYEDTKYGVLGLVVIGGILSAISRMEPMIVAAFSFGTLVFITVETVKLNDTFKSYINFERNRIEREEREVWAEELKQFMNIGDGE